MDNTETFYRFNGLTTIATLISSSFIFMPQAKLHPAATWLTRLQAMGFGVLLVVLIEGGFRLAGFGGDEIGEDPFVGFSAMEPLFGLNATTNRYELRPERSTYFVSDGFYRHKDSDTFRIFVLGGSTVQGRPYSIETAFPRWLQINLELAYPEKKFEVVNCGGISYASYRLVPILKECLNYEPDLFILCTGQNEFLEARTYGAIKSLAQSLGGPVKTIRTLASYQALDSLYQSVTGAEAKKEAYKKPTLKMEVDAFLDYKRGLSAYHRDPEWREGVIAHFKENVRRIHTISEEADVPLVVLNPPVNLKDTPPFKSEHTSTLSESQKAAFQDYLNQAQEHYQGDVAKAAELLEWALELDPNYALTHYSLAHCYLALANHAKAKNHFTAALNEDICPLRLLPSMRTFVNEYCETQGIPSLDLQPLLTDYSGEAVIGAGILVDHVHPSIKGHQVIGQETTKLLFKSILPQPSSPEWKSGRSKAYKTQLDNLDGLYYARGQIRLDNLMDWTKGQTEGPPIEMHVPIDRQ